MKASEGDRLVLVGHKTGRARREGLIVEVKGEDGTPPFVVRWTDDDSEGVLFPGTDAVVERTTDA